MLGNLFPVAMVITSKHLPSRAQKKDYEQQERI